MEQITYTPIQPVYARGCPGRAELRPEYAEGLKDVDILDGTPLRDIRPYVPRFDGVENPQGGWTQTIDDQTARRRGRRGFRDGGGS